MIGASDIVECIVYKRWISCKSEIIKSDFCEFRFFGHAMVFMIDVRDFAGRYSNPEFVVKFVGQIIATEEGDKTFRKIFAIIVDSALII